ncbi:MAG: adenylate/guanylate cyclase domain-containing protein, partial [Saprospiraceae bacterium]|nr:adenylate/guanylate cyclase domain-containing protein [Saprospiraceae bacterium]
MAHVTNRTLAAVMFADIVGYTAMMQENEEQARQLRDRHRVVIERAIADHGGELIQYYGDGTLSMFGSAKEAILGALEVQQQLHQEPVVPLRIGIHLGDIVRDEGGIYGDCVNVAARIESLAIPGTILFSEKVKRELENHPSLQTVPLGEYALKNVRRPIHVFALNDQHITVPRQDQIADGKHQKVAQTIAVLPFGCSAAGADAEYFAEGISEEIISGMSRVDGVSIISRTTCLKLQNSGEDMNAMARKSKVSHILEGRVRMAGNRVRVSAQLSSTADGYQVWSEVYEKDLDDIFAVQDEIARHVVSAMKVNFAAPTQSAPIIPTPTRNVDAHRLYLKAMHHLQKHNPENVQKAVDILTETLALDDGYSAARCGLSHCYAFMGSCGMLPPTDAYAQALHHAMTAIENDPKNAEAHLAMANIKFYNYWDWDGAFRSFVKAEELGLSSTLLHQSLGLYYMATGQPGDGVARMQQALEQDPLSVPVLDMLGSLYLFNEQNAEAIETFNEALELDPAFRGAIQHRGIALMAMGQYQQALEDFEEYHRRVNHPQKALTGLIITHHTLGNHDLTAEYIARLYERYEEDPSPAVEIDLALALTGIGDY